MIQVEAVSKVARQHGALPEKRGSQAIAISVLGFGHFLIDRF